MTVQASTGAATPAAPTSIAEFARGYPVLFVAILGSAVGCTGLQIYPLPFFVGPLQAEFGWSRGEISLAASFQALALFVAAPIYGRLCDRYGVRTVAPISIVLFSATLASASLISSTTGLYAAYAAGTLLGAGTGYACYSRAVAAWFARARGLTLGMTMAGPGMMAACIPFFLPDIIAEHGWRTGYLTLAGLALVSLLPVLFLLRDAPPGEGPAAKGSNRVVHADAYNTPPKTILEAIRTRQFWFMWTGIFLLSTVVVGFHVHLIGMFEQFNVPETNAHEIMALYGLSVLVSRIVVGFLVDRVHAPFVASAVFALTGVGCFAAATMGAPVIPLFVILLGASAGSEGDMMAYLTSRYFGMRSYSEIFSWVFSAMLIGVAVGPPLVGFASDRLGDYLPVIYVGGGIALFVSVLFATLGRFPTSAPEEPH